MTMGTALHSAAWPGRRPLRDYTPGDASSADDLAPPTAREAQLVMLIAQGLSNKLIASELNISPNTVRAHISNIMRKYKLRNRTQVAILLLPKIDAAQPA
jgi:DNA-binding NarL/FixJ family response regulator